MSIALSPVVMLDAVRREKQYRAAETYLIEFMKQSWDIIEPSQEFKDNWHLHVIAEHLQAVTDGEIENLIINIPPGCMKSILVSVGWPAWEWTHNPGLRYLGASYGADLAIRDAQKTRDIITSDWYSRRWTDVQLKKGSDQKMKYELTAGGWRLSTSVGGRATGEHPDRKIVDDPHNAKQAESDAERNSALVWVDRTLSTRGKSRGARTVYVMQRLHESDVTGHMLSSEYGYEHLCIPMEYDGVRRKTSIAVHGYDPRTKLNELLWPEMFTPKMVTELKRELGEYGTAGQLQQKPAPEGGGILKVAHFQLWPKGKELPPLEYVLQSYDGAYTATTTNDPTACTVWGIFQHEKRYCAALLDAWSDHLTYPKLRKQAVKDWNATYAGSKTDPLNKPRRPDAVLVENKSSGISLIQDLQQANVPVISWNPGNADKVARAHQSAPVLELDCLYLLESKELAGQPVTWAKAFKDQCEKFPNAEHDDYVDTFSQAINYLKAQGWFDLDRVPDEEPEEVDYYAERKRRSNPYGR